jgi:RimJ/RimL family protein N-acetyltransferase
MSFNVTSRDEVAGLVAVALEWPATDWGQAFVQRTRVNTEAKLLLMRHAFDHLGANRVEWKTDSENVRSREAFIRLGATEEGTLRNHMVRPDGSMRHSTCFSVIREEWPRVEQHVEGLLAGHSSP